MGTETSAWELGNEVGRLAAKIDDHGSNLRAVERRVRHLERSELDRTQPQGEGTMDRHEMLPEEKSWSEEFATNAGRAPDVAERIDFLRGLLLGGGGVDVAAEHLDQARAAAGAATEYAQDAVEEPEDYPVLVGLAIAHALIAIAARA